MGIEVEDASTLGDELEFGEIIACRYRVVHRHREHPLGELYRCVDRTSGKAVLLQRLRKEFSGEAVQDRLFETRGSATVEHAAIDDLIDYGEDIDGRLFLVSVWRDSPSLAQIPLPLGFHEALGLLELVATALAPLHAQGLVHGAIEPNNLLVDGEEELSCCLLDFGLVPALEAGARHGRALPLLTAPAYAAPELVSGSKLGPQADIYALGILMWELLYGAPPFRGPTLKILDAHLNSSLPSLEPTFDMPSSFQAVLQRMLAKQARERYADANELLEQLRHYAALSGSDAAEEASTAMLDLTALLRDAEEAIPTPVPVAAELSVEGEDDETVVFERVGAEVPAVAPPMFSLAAAAAAVPHADTSSEVPVAVLAAPRRRRPGRWIGGAALLSCVAVLGLIGSSPEAAELAALDEATLSSEQQVVSAVAPTPDAALVHAEPGERAKPKAGEPAELALPNIEGASAKGRLGGGAFRANKQKLYRKVNGRCVEGKMRRTVKVAVRVDASGEVDAATVMGGMGQTRLGRCVEKQARKLDFDASAEGGFYVYTLRLR